MNTRSPFPSAPRPVATLGARLSRFAAGIAAALCAVGLWAPAVVEAQPALMPVQFHVVDGGGGNVDAVDLPIRFSIYANETGGAAFHTEDALLDLEQGRGFFLLGSTDALDLTEFDGRTLYLGISVNGEPELIPRAVMATTPYAAFAGAVDWSGIQGTPPYTGSGPIQVTGTAINLSAAGCTAGQTWVFTGAGWACQSLTSFVVGSGLSYDGTTLAADTTIQRRLTGPCPANEYVYGLTQTGTPLCRADQTGNTTYTAGTGLQLSGNTFAVNTGVIQRLLAAHDCPFGIRNIDSTGTVVCATNAATTYSAGFGVSITGTVIAANTAQVQQRLGAHDCTYGIRIVAQNGVVTCASAPPSNTYGPSTGILMNASNQFSINQAYTQRRISADCTYGIRSVNEDGSVSCAANPSTTPSFGSCPDINHYMYGIAASGAPLCRHLRDYINSSCVMWIGWSDNNATCCSRVNHGSQNGGNNAGADANRRWYNWPGWGQLTGMRTGGDVDDNDWFYVGFFCL